MDNNKAFEQIVAELTGREKDIPMYCEKLAEHLNNLKAENAKVLDADYDIEKAETEEKMVQIYMTWIALDTLEEKGFKELDGEWVKVDK